MKQTLKFINVSRLLCIVLVSILVASCVLMLMGCDQNNRAAQFFSGHEDPYAELGRDGDMYIDIDDYLLYQKVTGEWIVLIRDFGRPAATPPHAGQYRAESCRWKCSMEIRV